MIRDVCIVPRVGSDSPIDSVSQKRVAILPYPHARFSPHFSVSSTDSDMSASSKPYIRYLLFVSPTKVSFAATTCPSSEGLDEHEHYHTSTSYLEHTYEYSIKIYMMQNVKTDPARKGAPTLRGLKLLHMSSPINAGLLRLLFPLLPLRRVTVDKFQYAVDHI